MKTHHMKCIWPNIVLFTALQEIRLSQKGHVNSKRSVRNMARQECGLNRRRRSAVTRMKTEKLHNQLTAITIHLTTYAHTVGNVRVNSVSIL